MGAIAGMRESGLRMKRPALPRPALLPLSVLAALALLVPAALAFAQGPRYDVGTPVLRDLYVDPVKGSDQASGLTSQTAFRTLQRAWSEIPAGTLSETGYRIRLLSGSHDGAYLETRKGTRDFPIVLAPAPDAAGVLVGATGGIGGLTVFDSSYVYLEGFKIAVADGDAFHCERCDHLLLRGMDISSQRLISQNEAVKINQSTNVFIEDSHIHGAGDNAIDMVAVQNGHVARNQIRDANDWCMYTKGGSANLRIEANEIFDCGTGGFTAGQGTGFQFMVSPWLHYEAYDIKFVNNIVHDTEGAGLGVNGGYNILFAYNTLFRVGKRSHGLEFVFGGRSCDGQAGDPGREPCATYLAAGGWGTTAVNDGTNFVRIPNRNVWAFNNLLSNPPDLASAWQHMMVPGPYEGPSQEGSNVPSPATADQGLRVVSNVFWNGPETLPIGIEEPDQGCQGDNAGCNATQLLAENAFNKLEPDFADVDANDVSPAPAGNLLDLKTAPLSSFPDDGRPTRPPVPTGELANAVIEDFAGAPRGTGDVLGALVKPAPKFSQTLLVPAVLSASGVNESFFTTQMSLLNRGKIATEIDVEYVDRTGVSYGGLTTSLDAGRQQQIPDVITWLRSGGASIPGEGNQVGTLRVTFKTLSSPDAGLVLARTTTPVANGRAGLAYPGVPYADLLTNETAFICGLRQDGRDRSNVALMHAGGAQDGAILLRLTVFSGDSRQPVVRELPPARLLPGTFLQLDAILEPLGLTRGFIKIERTQGTAPYYAFGIINDLANSDGSFIAPQREFQLAGRTVMTLPVAVESWPYETELFVVNTSNRSRRVILRYQADALGGPGRGVDLSLSLFPYEQKVLPSFVQYLRENVGGIIPPAGTTFLGSVRVRTGEGESDLDGLFTGARTFNPGPAGFYGLYYGSVGRSEGAVFSAHIQGLRQDEVNRSNLALINTGERDSSESRYRLEIFDGATGTKVATVEGPETTVPAGGFKQIERILGRLAPGVSQGWVRVTRRTGSNPFIAYGVINDGGAPGERSGDGSFVEMQGGVE